MKNLIRSSHLTWTILFLLALAGPVTAQDQEPQEDLVRLQGTVVGTGEGFVLPVEPPIGVAFNFRTPARGEATPLGAVTFVGISFLNLGADGKIVSFSNGLGAMTAANGDAVFLSFSGLARPPEAATPTVGRFEGAFVVTGGRRGFLGARGSGTFTGTLDSRNGEFRVTFDGMVTAPKA